MSQYNSTDRRLIRVFKTHVQYDQSEMRKNMAIADDVVDGFIMYLSSEESIRVTKLKQGSAIEGIKVGTPDEFDYLLVFDYTHTSVDAREARNVSGNFRDKLAGYWQLKVDCSSLYPISDFCTNGSLSTTRYKRRFQTAINKYMERLQQGRYVQGIRSSSSGYASINNPALTLKVQKSGGRTISIDMSICVKANIRKPQGGMTTRYFIAKEHPSEDVENFWLVVNSQEELNILQTIGVNVKIYYCITKFLLQKQGINSYIIKTAFLHIYSRYKDSGLREGNFFFEKMLQLLRDSFESKRLTCYHNASENLLARYADAFLEQRANYFRRLCNKTYDERVDELLQQVLPTEGVVRYATEAATNENCVMM